MSATARLRAATQHLHDRVDAAYGGFRLDETSDYRRFLRAHAEALSAVEAALTQHPGLPAWRARADLLAADLADLGEAMPPPTPFALADDAAAWGALYVSEGSRLGGAMLARGVPAGLPSRYLAAAHRQGEWRDLRLALDEAERAADPAWLDRAAAGAEATFALYERAAAAS